MESAAAQKLSEQRGRGEGIGPDGHDIVEKFAQTVGLGVLRRAFGHHLEQGQGLAAQAGELKEQGTIEHDVGVLLIGEDPLAFAGLNLLPAADGLLSGVVAILVVAHDTPQQAVVAGGDIVVVVQQDSRERADVDFELVDIGDVLGELRIEPMDTLHDQQGMTVDLKMLATRGTLACGEIVFGQLDFLALQEILQVLLELGNIERVDRLVVIVSIGITRGLGPVNEIVIHREGKGLEAAGHELDAQALAKRGLARTGGAANHDEPDLRMALYLLGDVAYLLLLEGLADIDDVDGFVMITAGLVEFPDSADSDDVLPALVLAKDFEHLLLLDEGLELVGMFGIGDA